jgi:hypothetical protein
MKQAFVLNPAMTSIEIKDEMDSCINKIKAILTCTMFSTTFLKQDMALDNNTLYHALCIADDYMKNLELLISYSYARDC